MTLIRERNYPFPKIIAFLLTITEHIAKRLFLSLKRNQSIHIKHSKLENLQGENHINYNKKISRQVRFHPNN